MQATWHLPNGETRTATVKPGQNLMQVAVAQGIPQIIGECGGSLSCATCHVVVDPAWFAKTGGPGEFEDDMLDATEVERRPTSRLSCQIKYSDMLDGLILRVPK